MSDEIMMGDIGFKSQLNDKSSKLNLSLEKLVDRYIRRGLYMDGYYEPPKLTREELMEILIRVWKKIEKEGFLQKSIILRFSSEDGTNPRISNPFGFSLGKNYFTQVFF